MKTANHRSAGVQHGARFFLREPNAKDLDEVLRWMQHPSVYKWFDFGAGRQVLSGLALSMMAKSERYCMRVFGELGHPDPIGMVVLGDVQHPFRAASFWVVRDRTRRAYPGITTDASRAIVDHGFRDLGLVSINAWAVEINHRSIRLLHAVGFLEYGFQRDCHVVDGQVLGRVHFELLSSDFRRHPFEADPGS